LVKAPFQAITFATVPIVIRPHTSTYLVRWPRVSRRDGGIGALVGKGAADVIYGFGSSGYVLLREANAML